MKRETNMSALIETNREHFFGDERLIDSIALLTYENHNREECRLFKNTLKEMGSKRMQEWLDSPVDKLFNW